VYDVIGVLGAGGMGEVYRAVDRKLHREVAIKVLPATLTDNRERLARFEREAQVLASLNHRHVAQVYGLDESGGAPALVMELVEGPTLAQLIADHSGAPMPVAQAVAIARQIADGLDAAHEKGIVHRDLKPGNVAMTTGGDVKILDFGVAKSPDTSALTGSPGRVATEAGIVLGTPAYMSPEQARGLAVDKRADIWSFGCLLYELLTGRQPFAGATPSDSLAAVLERDPDMSVVPAGTPSSVRALLRHCLQKDPRRRLRDIADARLVLDEALQEPDGEDTSGRRHVTASRRIATAVVPVPALWLIAGVAVIAVAAAGMTRLLPDPPPAERPRRTIAAVLMPRGMQLAGSDIVGQGSEDRLAISPDGSRLAVIATDESRRTRLWVRNLASAAFQPLPDTDGASSPFWSPDSQSLGFVAAGKLRVIRLGGDTPITIHDAGFRSSAWNQHDLILFAPNGASPLYAVPARGGAATPATVLDEAAGEVQHGSPAFLPDGRRFLYFSIGSRAGALDPRGIYLGSLDASERPSLLIAGATQPRYANGHVFFVQNGTLLAQGFDVERLALRGAPQPLVEEVTLSTGGATGSTSAYSVSDTVLAYRAAVRTESRPVWFDRSGQELAVVADAADYGDIALSPDGRRLAVSVRDPERFTRDLWIYDAQRGGGQRLTSEPGDEFAPVWSPDGTRLLFSSMVKGLVDLQITSVNTRGETVRLNVDTLGLGRYAADWSPDGRHLLYIGGGRAIARSDLWVAPVASPDQARALLDSGFIETQAKFAPTSGWFLYASNETGRMEVYADRFPGLGAKRLVSATGGSWPRWSRDGSEMFYVSSDNRLMAAAVRATRDTLEIGAPHPLFTVRPRPPARLDAYPYDVSPDGRRFVVNTVVEDPASAAITLVFNWAAGLTTP
jgi:Tol biopolymer transport system component